MSELQQMEAELDGWMNQHDGGEAPEVEAEPENVEVIEEVVEETIDEDGNLVEEEPEAEEEDAVEATEEENDKPRSKMVPRKRMDEVIEQRNQDRMALEQEQRARQDLEYKLNQQTEAFDKLMAKLSGDEPDSDGDDGDEILDEALKKEVDSKFSQIEERGFQSAKQQEVAYLGENGVEVMEKAVAAIAIEVMQDEVLYGRPVDEGRAEQAARQIVEQKMRNMYKENAKPGAIAQAINKKAQYFDYLMSQPSKKEAGQKAQNGVNMKAVDKARKTAGAPTVDKEAVTMQPNNIVDKEVRKVRDAGFDDDYLQKFGF